MATATQTKQPQTKTVERQPEPPQGQPFEQAEPSLLDKAIEETTRQLDHMADRYSAAIRDSAGHLRRAMLVASGVRALQKAITPEIMEQIKALRDTPMGFMCDKEYDEKTLKNCFIHALLEGLYPVGNEWNIISGKMMIVKNGYKRRLKELDGFSDLQLKPGTPVFHNGMTVVRVGASWRFNGVKNTLTDAEGKPGRIFAVATNKGSTADNTIGKAERKALRAVWEAVTGSEQTDYDDGETDDLLANAATAATDGGKSAVDKLAEKLGAGKTNGTRPRATPEQLREIGSLLDEGVLPTPELKDAMHAAEAADVDALLASFTPDQATAFLVRLRGLRDKTATSGQRKPGEDDENF